MPNIVHGMVAMNATIYKPWLCAIALVGVMILMNCSKVDNSSKHGISQPEIRFDYGTKNDSARYYFTLGWEHIMDKGQWTLSEKSFRKAVDLDPDFLIGKSLVGRISTNLEERLNLHAELESKKYLATSDERLLLDAYLLNIEAMNARAQAPDKLSAISLERRKISEQNFRTFLKKYPEESYIMSEYIEVIHALYGAQPAIDSLRLLTMKRIQVPFFLRYRVSLETELNNFDRALALAGEFEKMMDDPTLPEPFVAYAEIYDQMDSMQIAKFYIEKAVALDSMHLIARSMRTRINEDLHVDHG